MIRQYCSDIFKNLIQSSRYPLVKSCCNSIVAVGKVLFILAIGLSATGANGATEVETSADSAKPVDYVNACDPLGRAYFYAPGMTSCVRIGGDLMARQTYFRRDQSEISETTIYETRSRTFVDIWRGSELGNIRTYISLEGKSGLNPYLEFDNFYMRIGNLIAGKLKSIANMDHGSYVFSESGFSYSPDNTVWQLRYTLGLDQGVYISKAIEQPVGSFNHGDNVLQQDSKLPDIILSANYAQDWGQIKVSGGSHMNQTRPLGKNEQKYSKLGFFSSIGAQFNLTQSLKAGLTGSYADGALSRIGIRYPSDSIFNNSIMINSKGHNFFSGITYDLNPAIRFNINGGFYFSREGYEKNNRKVKSYLGGSSVDYRLFRNTRFTIGGVYEEIDLSKAGGQFNTDSDGKDRRMNLITQIRQQF